MNQNMNQKVWRMSSLRKELFDVVINISNNKNGLCDVRRQSQAKLTVKHFDIFPAEHRRDAFHQDQLVPICDII